MGARLFLLAKVPTFIVSTGVALILSTKPDDVLENVRIWSERFGLDRPPAWTQTETFAVYAPLASIVLLCAVMRWMLWPAFRWVWRRAKQRRKDGTASSEASPDWRGSVRFDPTTRDGIVTVGSGAWRFALYFYPQNTEVIGVSKSSTNLRMLARVRFAKPGTKIAVGSQDDTSRDYAVSSGDSFIAQNHAGYYIVGKVDGVDFEGRGGAERHEVRFTYEIDHSGDPVLTAI